MEEKMIRTQLREVEDALRRNQEERAVLDSLVSGYRGWLKLRSSDDQGSPRPSATIPESNSTTKAEPKVRPKGRPQKGNHSVAKGTISMRAAVLQAIREADGTPIHVSKILDRALDLGAATEGQEPKGVVDLMAYSLRRSKPIEKVGPRLWRWTGGEGQ